MKLNNRVSKKERDSVTNRRSRCSVISLKLLVAEDAVDHRGNSPDHPLYGDL